MYNCLEYKSEKDRIKYDSASENDKNDEENGFLLLPDLKWSGKIDELYLLAIIKKRNIKSLRDLTSDHLPLLQNILNKGSVCTLYISVILIFYYTFFISIYLSRMPFINCMEFNYLNYAFMSIINRHSIIFMSILHI